jgi:hypothetical protein
MMREYDKAKVIQVIETTLSRRGTGKDAASPIRCITQYWSLDGELLAEVDPCPPKSDAVQSGHK